MPNNITFTTTFTSDSKTIIKDSEQTNFPANNVKDYRVAKKWRSNNILTNAYIGVDLGSGDIMDFFFLEGYNLTSGATIKIQGSNLADFFSLGVDMTITYNKENIIKYDSTGVQRSNRYWRFLFTDASNPDGYIEVGRMIIAKTYSQITLNCAPDWQKIFVDPSLISHSESGSAYHKLKTKYNQLDNIRWEEQTADNTVRDDLITIWDAVGVTEEVVVTIDPVNDLNYSTLYGRLSGGPIIQKPFKNRWTISLPLIVEAP